jgi:HEAT repeat protein
LADTDLDVRTAAIVGLREVGTAEAQALLIKAQQKGTQAREAATLAAEVAGSLRDDFQASAADAQAELRDTVAGQIAGAKQQGQQTMAQATDEVQAFVDDASQQAQGVVERAQAVGDSVSAKARQASALAAELREANLPEQARREAVLTLNRMASDADAQVRASAAQAMGEVADEQFLPVLMGLLADDPDVRLAAMTSLAQVAGGDITVSDNQKPLGDEERAQLWQLWYRQRQATQRGTANRR